MTLSLSRSYHFEFDHPVDKLWAVVADTPRWGEASGFPKYQASEVLQPDGSVRVFGKIEIAGFSLDWEEPPANWIEPRWFEQTRLFRRGPLRRMTNSATLNDLGAGSSLDLELAFESANPLGSLIARRLLSAFEGKVQALLDTADQLIRAEQPDLFETSYRAPRKAVERARRLAEEVARTPYAHGLADRLVDYIGSSQEVDLWAMRPIAIARRWGVDSEQAVELFLQSVRAGLLESRWDILCPRCRIGKAPTANIGDLPRGVHCDACNIDFEADFASNVELSFSPSPSIRPLESGFFCRSGPGVTPHIKGQCSLPPGSERSMPLTLQPGDYRLRTLEAGDEVSFGWDGDRFPTIAIGQDSIDIDGLSADGEITLVNRGELPRTAVIEEQNWLRDVLTAEHATTLQAFRDLFSDQVLRPGDEVSIRNVCFVFTDLVGSTELFSRIGDAAAYRLIRDHFAELATIVRRHRGSIVKTAGDGVHAAFMAPDDALAAAMEMQLAMPDFNRRHEIEDISIRIGLHGGSSIAVTLNDRLDYYGESVNLAARLEAAGAAGDITMSAQFSQDPGVQELLRQHSVSNGEIGLKGFPDPVAICRINPSEQA
jgi:class 3 adenylate cyclase